MKKLFSFKDFKSKAFTLIELLIVIAILGILAVGLIAALDPNEQIRRANDASTKQAALESARAYDRYYTSTAGSGTGTYPPCAAVADAPLTALVNAGELKSVNPNLTASQNVGAKPRTCFIIASKALKLDPLTKYVTKGTCGVAATTDAACTASAGTASSTCTVWCDQ